MAPKSAANPAPLPPAPRIETLRHRPEFLKAASALRQGSGSMMVQGRLRDQADSPAPDLIRVGFTCSKKVGNAVARNRAKRRLREVARAVLPAHGRPGWDYVLIGRAEATGALPFPRLIEDFTRALAALHEGKTMPPRPPRKPKGKGRGQGKEQGKDRGKDEGKRA